MGGDAHGHAVAKLDNRERWNLRLRSAVRVSRKGLSPALAGDCSGVRWLEARAMERAPTMGMGEV